MNQKKHTKWIIAAIALLGGAGYMIQQHNRPAQMDSQTVAVKTARVERRDVPLEVTEVGKVAAYESVSVRARIDSQVSEVKFHDGETVQKGDLLFLLDDRALQAQLSQMQANLQRDKAQLDNARQQHERVQGLNKKGFESPARMDETKATFEAQKAIVNATQAELESLKVQLGYTRIMAPISGRTGTINVTPGNNVKANDTQSLVTINQIQPIRVQMSLSQQYFDPVRAALKNGEVPVIATRDGSDSKAEGQLEYIDNTLDQSTGTFVVRAVFPNKDEALWPGMFVTLSIKLGEEKNVLIVPEVAVQHGQEGDYVFTVVDGKAQKHTIKLKRMQEGSAIVSSGVEEHDTVVVDGLMSLKDGSTVTVQDAPPPEPLKP